MVRMISSGDRNASHRAVVVIYSNHCRLDLSLHLYNYSLYVLLLCKFVRGVLGPYYILISLCQSIIRTPIPVSSCSLQTVAKYKVELEDDPIVRAHLASLYDNLLEQNLCRIIEPFSRGQVRSTGRLVAGYTDHIGCDLTLNIPFIFFT